MLYYVIVGTIVVSLIILFCFSWRLSTMVIHPIIKGYEDTYNREVQGGRLDENLYNSWNKKDFFIKSNYGYNLSCELIEDKKYENSDERVKIMVLVHGITWSKYGEVKYANMFIKKGFKVLIYDHRNHGLSGTVPTTMGYYEKFDLKTVIDWCYNTYGQNITVATHGESMGSATVLAHLEIDNRPAFVIADCGYSDLYELLKYQLKDRYNLPDFPFVPLSSMLIRLRAGFNIHHVSPIKIVAKSNIPILFIHGENDLYVPTYMGKAMYEAKKDNKELFIAPNAAHAESQWKNPKEYEKVVYGFMDKYFVG
ncbi:MAG: alpha/beta hydrolase [Clostridium sp.]|uniref:alpha/beta hydrolase n=1 Tax=Clostridium sp. TaxID=1506 RepID=UPI0030458549